MGIFLVVVVKGVVVVVVVVDQSIVFQLDVWNLSIYKAGKVRKKAGIFFGIYFSIAK